jgi:hypothetical protein
MRASSRLLWSLIPFTVAACSTSATPQSANETAPHSDRAGIGLTGLSINAPVTIDPRRSLAVTDDAILASFSFQAVMDQLVAQSGVAGLTSLQLFQQWWSSAVTCPPPDPTVSRFAYQCPRAEGEQAQENPFLNPATDASYVPIGLFNRFDLAPVDGSNCGEYRIVFARKSGFSNFFNRNLIIFEAVLPNPTPDQGLEGCMPVAQLWAGLTTVNDVNQRASQLHDFYFNGLPGFEPVVHVNHYGALGKGQIRSNQFMHNNQVPNDDWMLREFKLEKTGATVQILPVTVKVNPFAALFAPTMLSQKAAFDNTLTASVSSLAVNDINTFNWAPGDTLNGAQSDEQSNENNYVSAFAAGGPGTNPLRPTIASKLGTIGSTLAPEDIVARAQALSCAGCHQLSNGANLGGGITWPSSLGFTHVGEQVEQGPDGSRHVISPALTNVFLPHRAAVLSNFLPDVCVPQTCQQQNAQCGSVTDGCNGTLNCGTCAAGLTCQANQCQCKPLTCAQLNVCGSADNGCGGTINCNCRPGFTCSDGECIKIHHCNPPLHDCGDGVCVRICM